MTVAVINPQDCLQGNRFNMKFPKYAYNPNRKANRPQINRKKRSPSQSRAVSGVSPPKFPVKADLVMGQVKILKRGEELTSAVPFQAPETKSVESGSQNQDLDLGSTGRLGPDPKSVPTQIRLTGSKNRVGIASFYAGSAFITSPPPSSLPLPAFFTKKTVSVQNDEATTGLRRILKLDAL